MADPRAIHSARIFSGLHAGEVGKPDRSAEPTDNTIRMFELRLACQRSSITALQHKPVLALPAVWSPDTI